MERRARAEGGGGEGKEQGERNIFKEVILAHTDNIDPRQASDLALKHSGSLGCPEDRNKHQPQLLTCDCGWPVRLAELSLLTNRDGTFSEFG